MLRPTALACLRFMDGCTSLRFRCNGGMHTRIVLLRTTMLVLCQLGTANRERTTERHQLWQHQMHLVGAAERDTNEMAREG